MRRGLDCKVEKSLCHDRIFYNFFFAVCYSLRLHSHGGDFPSHSTTSLFSPHPLVLTPHSSLLSYPRLVTPYSSTLPPLLYTPPSSLLSLPTLPCRSVVPMTVSRTGSPGRRAGRRDPASAGLMPAAASTPVMVNPERTLRRVMVAGTVSPWVGGTAGLTLVRTH